MGYEDFISMMETQMREKLGKEAQVKLHQITKNNSVVLDALSVSEAGSSVAPTIYLNDFYQEYLDGAALPELVEKMEALYRKCRLDVPLDTSFYGDYEKVKDRLACRLISRGKNEELLKRIPYLPFLDLAVVVYYSFEDANLGAGTILVYESHRRTWEVSKEELFEWARENTLRIAPEEFMSMRGILQKYRTEEKEEEEEDGLEPMYVLTNRGSYFGASCILFDSVLQKIAAELGEDYWVLPSSIHECIIVPASLEMQREELQQMVREINRSEVAPEDFLSDEVYFYQQEIHKLSM